MTLDPLALLGIGVMIVALFLTPLGVPGNWIMVGVLAIATWSGRVGLFVLLLCLAIATVAEIIEYFIVKRLNLRYGGSNRAFWGAIAGGIAGVILGLPIPIIGSVIAGFVGSFVGAAVVTLWETRAYSSAARVGWGVVIGRMWSAAAKTAAGIIIIAIGAASLLLR